MKKKIVFSQNMGRLAALLAQEIETLPYDLFSPPVVLVPNPTTKSWLSEQLVQNLKTQILFGLPILTVEEWASQPSSGKNLQFLELASLIYTLLPEQKDPELLDYLSEGPLRRKELARHLAKIFQRYREYAIDINSLASDCKNSSAYLPTDFCNQTIDFSSWQQLLYAQVFPNQEIRQEPLSKIYAFGLDFLPPARWDAIFSCTDVSIYLFSPCSHFWSDVCSDWEKKSLKKMWREKGVSSPKLKELDSYLIEPPSLLRNWGKLGKETLKVLENYDWESEEAYVFTKETTLLKKLQAKIVLMEEATESLSPDASIRLLSTGALRLQEVEMVLDEILNLVQIKGFAFSDILVLIPDIDAYAPLIQHVFKEKAPYRMHHIELGGASLYAQAFLHLLSLLSQHWCLDEAKKLFSSPCFYKKQGWDASALGMIEEWLERSFHDPPCFDELFDALVMLKPEHLYRIEMGKADELEEFVFTLESLFLSKFKEKERTLADWSTIFKNVCETFLFLDEENEADVRVHKRISELLKKMEQTEAFLGQAVYPFEWVFEFLQGPLYGQIHAHQLHGVLFAPFSEGAQLSAKAIFWMGMNEENFPRIEIASSLDLLKKHPFYLPKGADRDRYRLLQSLLGAEEMLFITYGNFSKEEGKPLGPSPLINELFSFLEKEMKVSSSSLQFRALNQKENNQSRKLSPFPEPKSFLQGKKTLGISDLKKLLRNPWRFYLEKSDGIKVEKDEENSFYLQRAKLLRASFSAPIEEVLKAEKIAEGMLKEAFSLEIKDELSEWKKRAQEWDLMPLKITFLKTCRSPRWIDPHHLHVPALCLSLTEAVSVTMVGQIENASRLGYVHIGKDDFEGLCKVWPEALAVSMVLGTESIFCIQSGSLKKIQEPEKIFKQLVLYALEAETAPCPLLTEWLEPFLKGKWETFEKKRTLLKRGKGFVTQDPVHQWVLSRYLLPSPEEIQKVWGNILEHTFTPLLELFPSREKREAN